MHVSRDHTKLVDSPVQAKLGHLDSPPQFAPISFSKATVADTVYDVVDCEGT